MTRRTEAIWAMLGYDEDTADFVWEFGCPIDARLPRADTYLVAMHTHDKVIRDGTVWFS